MMERWPAWAKEEDEWQANSSIKPTTSHGRSNWMVVVRDQTEVTAQYIYRFAATLSADSQSCSVKKKTAAILNSLFAFWHTVFLCALSLSPPTVSLVKYYYTIRTGFVYGYWKIIVGWALSRWWWYCIALHVTVSPSIHGISVPTPRGKPNMQAVSQVCRHSGNVSEKVLDWPVLINLHIRHHIRFVF